MGIVNWRHPHARARPAHFAVAIDAYIQRGEPRVDAHKFRGFLIDADVAFGHHFGVFDSDAAQKCVRGAVSTGYTVVQIGKDREISLMR